MVGLSALVDCFKRAVKFVLSQFDHFRKKTDAGMMRDLFQATVGRTEFLVHFENAVELRRECAAGGVNCACAAMETGLDVPRQRFVAIDRDDEQSGALSFMGRRPRQGRESQRGQTPDAEVQFAVLSEAVAELLRAFTGTNVVVNNQHVRVACVCSHSACSKEPGDAEQPFDRVDSQIWLADTSAGEMHVSNLEGESEVIPHKPVYAGIRLQVELES